MTKSVSYLREHREIIWLLAILALSTLLRLAFLHEPLDRDEGQYAAIAQEILRGGLPYRDAIEIKPPGAFYLYALAIWLLGATPEALRLFTACYAMGTVVAVYGVTRQLGGVRAGLVAALIYGFYAPFPLLQGSSSNTEVFLVLPMTAGIWFLLRARASGLRSQLGWSGLCAALTLVIKPSALPVVALQVLLLPWIRPAGERLKRLFRDLAAFLLPQFACAAALFGYFYLRGGLEDLLYWTVTFPSSYRGSAIAGPSLEVALMYLRSTLFFPVLAGIPAAIALAATRRNLPGVLPLLLIVAATLGIALPGKYFPHYFIMLLPFLAVSGGIGITRLANASRARAAGAGLVLLVAFGYSVWRNYPVFATLTPEQVSAYKYSDKSFAQSVGIARYLREHTTPEEYIFQWGFEPELYFLADRRSPTPYLVSIAPEWSPEPAAAILKLEQGLREKKPAYIVLQPDWADHGGSFEVNQYLKLHCYEERSWGMRCCIAARSSRSPPPQQHGAG
jgi:4-amino-4-deoxy-L-arabinose transferase-like glycosyltransferase